VLDLIYYGVRGQVLGAGFPQRHFPTAQHYELRTR